MKNDDAKNLTETVAGSNEPGLFPSLAELQSIKLSTVAVEHRPSLRRFSGAVHRL